MKPLSAGAEIDAWCTKCRMDLSHRIIALVEGRPKRVICQTCNSEHNYRSPKGVASPTPARRASPTSARAPKGQRIAKAEQERLDEWKVHVLGKDEEAFKKYSIDGNFSEGELLLHKKFGEGYVTEVLEDSKVSVMFRDGPRTLAHQHDT